MRDRVSGCLCARVCLLFLSATGERDRRDCRNIEEQERRSQGLTKGAKQVHRSKPAPLLSMLRRAPFQGTRPSG